MSEAVAAAPPYDGRSLLTNSRLTMFRRCAKEHAITYEDGLRLDTEEEALRLGSLAHVGLDAWYRKVAEQDDGIASYEEAVTRELLASEAGLAFDAAKNALDVAGAKESDPVVRLIVEEMLRGYHIRWRYEAMKFRVLGVELPFRAQVINPATGGAMRIFEHAGKIDVLLESREDGSKGVMEHKTSSDSLAPDSRYWKKLAMDSQISGYVIGAESLGFDVSWTLYDVLGKPQLRPKKATPIESRKYRLRKTEEEKQWGEQDARLLYKEQRAQDESLEEYRVRVRQDLIGDEAALASSYQRRAINRTLGQMEDFLHDVVAQARVMRDLQIAGRRPRNVNACERFGRMCPLWSHCAEGEELRTVEEGGRWRRLTFVHPELEGAFIA